MAIANCTRATEVPVAVEPGRYFVTADTAIHAPRGEIQAGDLVLIDPVEAPEAGDLVLIGADRLEAFAHQGAISGVAVQAHRAYC